MKNSGLMLVIKTQTIPGEELSKLFLSKCSASVASRSFCFRPYQCFECRISLCHRDAVHLLPFRQGPYSCVYKSQTWIHIWYARVQKHMHPRLHAWTQIMTWIHQHTHYTRSGMHSITWHCMIHYNAFHCIALHYCTLHYHTYLHTYITHVRCTILPYKI